jgi:xanthine dehydrogenase accessory factor
VEEIYRIIKRAKDRGEKAALATVIRAQGSTPREVGAKMLVLQNGEIVGSVSGGCVEAEVYAEAREVIRTGQPRTLSFQLTAEKAWDSGLICGGTIEVFIEPV